MENFEEFYCHFTKVNLENKKIIFDYADGSVYAIENNRLVIYRENKAVDTSSIHEIPVNGCICYVKYLSIFNIVFLASDTELILYDQEEKKIIFLLNIQDPIVELCWNPFETLFVVVHNNLSLTSYICTKEYIEIKDKSHLNAEVPVPVLSGWGSTQTQFQGPKSNKKVQNSTEEVVQTASNGPPKISWRGNGELFVVNYHVDGQRFLKVFNADLEALNQSISNPILQESVAFMSQGQCIACCTAKNNAETQLILYEKNCKIKSEFRLGEITGSVIKISYHPHMNILAIFYNNNNNSFINIYLFSNSRCFLKQQLFYPPECKVHDFQWLNLNENLFTTCKIVVFTSKSIDYRYFRFIINRCPNTATVGVINGNKIDFSLFDKKIVPPPFSYYSFKHENPINRILFHPTKYVCILIDSYFQIRVLLLKDETVEKNLIFKDHNLTGKVNFVSVNWKSDGLELILENEKNEYSLSEQSNEIHFTLKIVSHTKNIILPYNDTCVLLPGKIIDKFSNYIYLTKQIVNENDKQLEFEFALSGNREFYVNDIFVCPGVTSFYIFRGYLIFTHSNSKLYCIRLRDHVVYTNGINLNKVFNREIEQGGVIVACTNLISPQIILQMPRGNIETIGCKLITIDVIEEKLKENKWDEVLNILRIEKVNWNVLIDLNPDRFRIHIEDFVKAAKNNTILSNIVTEFCLDENCFQTFYKNYSPFSTPKFDYDKKSIVKDLLRYLVSTDCINNLPCIAAIQQKHISLKAALKSINDIFNCDQSQNESVCSRVLRQILAQEHFKDVENAAYNLYDLDFLTLIYRNSLEDPKIYEPEIKSFRSMSVMERKFRMSVRGKNLVAAVKYLLRWETADEDFIINFIVKSHLEDIAYSSIEDYHRHFRLVTVLYAKTLSTLKKYAEAGIILKKAKLYNEALLEYKKGLDWREVTSLCSILDYEIDEQKKLFKELVDDLVKANKIDDSVILLETYMNDYKTAIDILVQKNIYRRAICLAETYKEYNLIETEIVPKLNAYMLNLAEKIENFAEQFVMYADRLNVVRDERISKMHMVTLGTYDDQDDLYSEASSQVSITSKSTSRSRGSTLSSRNRRKEEKKKIDLKQGGFYEDIALIRALHILYNEVFNFGDEIKDICLAGYQYNLPLVSKLHKNLCELQNNMKECIPKIWSDVFVKEDESDDYAIMAIIQNKQDLDPEYRYPPSVSNKSWRLELFS